MTKTMIFIVQMGTGGTGVAYAQGNPETPGRLGLRTGFLILCYMTDYAASSWLYLLY